MVEFSSLQEKVILWAREKGIGGADNVKAQMNKLGDEWWELDAEIDAGNVEKAKMELGDCLVVCTILAMKLGSSVEECVGMAYEKIKARKGTTVNGVFVKEE